ncbi:hypothetical protein FH972_021115 [Carpinus fangiana]|uniref:Formin GTPase-binding domain-containing protein n=1 Tax=Carpinus fangiana TaxID=176857 RepID=A0A5N6KNS2_9ROSI|nr:hypothetical protein FH972_021115 [Carpinus fangiana]
MESATTSAACHPSPERKEHKHSRTATVTNFKSLISSGRSPVKQASPQRKPVVFNKQPENTGMPHRAVNEPCSPAGNTRGSFQVLGEVQNRGPLSPQRPAKSGFDKAAVKHKRSMTELIARMSPKKNSHKPQELPRDKENTTPPGSSDGEAHTPIWAQFASQRFPPSQNYVPRLDQSPVRPSASRVNSDAELTGALQSPSRVRAAVAMYNNRGETHVETQQNGLSGEELDSAFEAILAARNIPEHQRASMRTLVMNVKREFIKNDTNLAPKNEEMSPTKSSFWSRSRDKSVPRGREAQRDADRLEKEAQAASPTKRGRSRSRGRASTIGKGDKSPFKRPRSTSKARSIMSLKNFSSSSVNSMGLDGTRESKEQQISIPDDFTAYLQEQQHPQSIEIGRVHKLRLLVRNESISWTDTFIGQGGMLALIALLERIMHLEWREEHEDVLLHEVLLCLKGLCTTKRAQDKLTEVAPTLFPSLLKMLFDEERKGPSEFNTRDPDSPEDERPVGFIEQMQKRRPFQVWCREATNVTKEVFWIFLHHLNVIPMISASTEVSGGDDAFFKKHFPRERPPVPAAPYVGGVEWEATNYLAQHLDLLNGLIAAMPSHGARIQLREELRVSGFEKLMGGTLRLCKEKFYGAVHDVLRTWVSAALDDGWDVHDVRMGPPKEERSLSKSPAKKKADAPPKLELPKLDLGEPKAGQTCGDAWL